MPWTASARHQYARTATRYTTDLTDTEFALIAPHLPAPSRLGRPRKVDLREVLNAILYLLRTSCPWDLLPKELPAKSTVFGYFRRWWEDGTWQILHAKLVVAAREQAGREASPTALRLARPQPKVGQGFEATLASAATMVHLASIQLLARRLARA